MKGKENNSIRKKEGGVRLVLALALVLFSLSFALSATPVNPDGIDIGANIGKAAASDISVNVSGGSIQRMNVTATIQNPRWKAFVGEVVGSFTLEDGSGNQIYDWTLASVQGRIYASRTAYAGIDWTTMSCATTAEVNTESTNMNLNGVNDNITATFKDAVHAPFLAAGDSINGCTHTLNTYRNGDKTQGNVDFEEVVIKGGNGNIIYAAILEEDVIGFDGGAYDFQMIVPEDDTTPENTLYYMYVELD